MTSTRVLPGPEYPPLTPPTGISGGSRPEGVPEKPRSQSYSSPPPFIIHPSDVMKSIWYRLELCSAT